MNDQTHGTEPLIFQGTVDQLEAAGDYIPLLQTLQDRRTNRLFAAVFGVIFGLWTVLDLMMGNAQALLYLALLAVLGVVSWRRDTGRSALGAVASSRRTRERYKARGKYNGNTLFRIELSQGECRVFFQDTFRVELSQGERRFSLPDNPPREVIDCRLFHKAVECDEIIWISGWSMTSLALPKALLTTGTVEDLRDWLRPHVKTWRTIELPPAWKERL